MKKTSQIDTIIYQSKSGALELKTDQEHETIWLTQNQMASLFDVQKAAISKHLKNIFDSDELKEKSVVSILETTASDNKSYKIKHFNFSGTPKKSGKKNILIYRVFLTFILLSQANSGYAVNHSIKEYCGFKHNPSGTAAISGGNCGSPKYVSFKTKKTFLITEEKHRSFYIKWLDDNVATLEANCGTGCLEDYIFIAPATIISCSNHDYRINFSDPNQPPDYSHNRPLLVDPNKKIYVCYDDSNNIQVFPFPKQPTIRPPKGFFSENAKIHDGELTVIYKNSRGKIHKINYILDHKGIVA
ncbi:MAG TPA: hypothetical protein VLJ15_04810 [Gammaproteobacteria bacterium]|nr:hypothetical protein [Gammaproteobacteria bacterium]